MGRVWVVIGGAGTDASQFGVRARTFKQRTVATGIVVCERIRLPRSLWSLAMTRFDSEGD